MLQLVGNVMTPRSNAMQLSIKRYLNADREMFGARKQKLMQMVNQENQEVAPLLGGDAHATVSDAGDIEMA